MSERISLYNPEKELNEFFHEKGQIEVVVGCMYSGKTEVLIQRLADVKRAVGFRVKEGLLDKTTARRVIRAFKPRLDDRDRKTKLASHAKTKWPAIIINEKKPRQILKHIDQYTRVVAIDEAQFFSAELIGVCEEMAARGIRVIVGGLDANFRGEAFGIMGELMARADVKEQRTATCMKCGGVATKTQRIIVERKDGKRVRRPANYDDPIVIVGALERYEARCRQCHDVPGRPAGN